MQQLAPLNIEEDIVQLGSKDQPWRSRKPTDRLLRFLNDMMRAVNDLLKRVAVLETTTSGTFTGTPSGTGTFTIPHGLGQAPTRFSAQTVGANFALVNVVSADSTNLVVKLFDAAGAAITAGSWSAQWEVRA